MSALGRNRPLAVYALTSTMRSYNFDAAQHRFSVEAASSLPAAARARWRASVLNGEFVIGAREVIGFVSTRRRAVLAASAHLLATA